MKRVALSLLIASALHPGTASAQTVTFTKDIAPIFQRSCQNCHRPGAIAPMSLMTYQDVRPWVRAIKAKVAAREGDIPRRASRSIRRRPTSAGSRSASAWTCATSRSAETPSRTR